MDLVLIFAGTLMLAVLLSELALRSVVSLSVLFLLAGFLFEEEVLGYLEVNPDEPLVSRLAELALFGVLFTDGMRSAFGKLRRAWRLPGRALLLGMPLTFGLTAVMARWIVGLTWTEAFLVGAILSPTDPVFASAIVGRESVPRRLRNLLNVESGLNDGLALPVVVALLEVLSAEPVHYGKLAGEVAGGVAIGVAVPLITITLERSRLFKVHPQYSPLNAFAVGLLVLAASKVTGMNDLLAAFSAGVTIASLDPAMRESFHRFGELVTELLKLAALLLFGALISPSFLANTPTRDYLFALIALLLARPIALGLALFRSEMPWKQRLAAMWFGPKGFASVVYGLMLYHHSIAEETRDQLFHVVAVVVAGSIIAHSSTDVLIARWLRKEPPDDPDAAPDPDEIEPDEMLWPEEREHARER